ncbi:hypothetical protein [Herpetosiphon giganteus]|uniref:hypothetical protein n=1 Tax=Herpetosiphon giganteus TaxID=2029754 RepID=UPI001958540F|nr:hypothetical protein [Herpetosiphon giganteus]MBM7846678.1 hypothetical protein [Herpetosiphon giganteus]
MSAIRDGLLALVADVRTGIVQFGAQARQYLTRTDAAHVLLIGFGLLFADIREFWLQADPLLAWLDNGLVLGTMLAASALGARWALIARTAAQWRIGQQFIEAMARLALVRVGVGFFGPAVVDMIRTMPLESSTLAVAFALVWLLVWPKRGCRCHTD